VSTDFKFATIRLATGPRVHYAEHGNPDGDPVVFLHGWPDSQRVSRIVLIGTAVSAVSPVTREVQADMVSLEDPVPVEFARSFQAGTAYAPLPDAFFERLIVESMKLPARLWRKIFDAVLAYDDAEQLTRIDAPTLLLWGERDGLFSRADQDRLAAAIKGARLKIYRETGHCPIWERPEIVAADLQAFLQQE
jgi:pimeloyl-ACP methyl ester carboxylesterase